MRGATLLLGILVAAGVADAAEPWTGPPVLVTTGEAVVRVAPDRAVVTFATETRAPTAREAQQKDAEAMQGVRRALAKAGVADAAIRTLAYDLQQEFDYANGKRIPRGFVSRNTIEVRVDDLATLGGLVEQAVSSGAAAVSGVRFELKDRDAVERDALRQAVADARARADAAAAGAGSAVTGLVRIEEARTIAPPPPRPMLARAMAAEAAPAETPIAPGEIEIRAQVTLTVALR